MYQILKLLKFPNIFHAFSEKEDGDLSTNFDLEAKIVTRREKFLGKLNLRLDDCVKMQVAHGDEVVEANGKLKGISLRDWRKAIHVDGLVTSKKNTFLFLLIADCLPIILYDPVNEVVGLVHAGWKGVDLNIVGKTIEKLGVLYETNPNNLVIGIGPAARKDSFIKENPSQKNDLKWKDFLEAMDGNYYKVDFVGLAKKQLVDSGIRKENIFDCGIDTVKDNRFFSHVREGKLPPNKQGRFACVVGIRSV